MENKILKIVKKYFAEPINSIKIVPLTGGMVNKVFLVTIFPSEKKFVLKYSENFNKGFEWEYKCLQTLNTEYKFKVPIPYFYSSYDNETKSSYLGMEYWNAVNMGMAFFTIENRKIIEKEIAESIAQLHCYTENEYYALFSEKKYKTLYEIMKKKYEENINDDVIRKIGKENYKKLLKIIENLEKIFIENEKPVLVHGDIWSTNVMLEREGNLYHLKGFVDPSPHFINREYELAYLQVFRMFSDELFRYYQKFHSIDEGFKIRRYFYWLHTMLIHIKFFGDFPYILRGVELINICEKYI